MKRIKKSGLFLAVLIFCVLILAGWYIYDSKTAGKTLATNLTFQGDKTIIMNIQDLDPGSLAGKDRIVLNYDLQGVCILNGPASALTLTSQDGKQYSVSLSDYAQNCVDGPQTATIPLRDFLINEPLGDMRSLSIQFWYPTMYSIQVQKIKIYAPTFLGISTEEARDDLFAKVISETKPLKTSRISPVKSKVVSTVSRTTAATAAAKQASKAITTTLPPSKQSVQSPIPTSPSNTQIIAAPSNTSPVPSASAPATTPATPTVNPSSSPTPVIAAAPTPTPTPAASTQTPTAEIVPAAVPSSGHFWSIRSVSSMKETKDKICGQDPPELIEKWISKAAELGINYISVETPYDDPSCGSSVAYTRAWVDAIHAHGLHVWHRHAPLAFEGIYSTAKDSSKDYIAQITNYIKANPSFFKDGDIFTPIPEPQNGGIKNITYCPQDICIFPDAAGFNKWLRDAISASETAFASIGLGGKMKIGYYGLDGFVTWGDNNPDWHGILEDATVAAMGNITIDHYPEIVNDTMENDLDELQAKYPNTPIVIGEWGTITGGDIVAQVKSSMQAAIRANVIGFNYWHFGFSGNEALINDDFSAKADFDTVKDFFSK